MVGVRAAPASEAALRAWWRVQAGWELPQERMPWLEVCFATDVDEEGAATALVPACCTWAVSGLNLQPTRGAATAAILTRLAGMVFNTYHFVLSQNMAEIEMNICAGCLHMHSEHPAWHGRGPKQHRLALLGRQNPGGRGRAVRSARCTTRRLLAA